MCHLQLQLRFACLGLLMVTLAVEQTVAQEAVPLTTPEAELIQQAGKITAELEARNLTPDLVKRQRDLASRLQELLSGGTRPMSDQSGSEDDPGKQSEASATNPPQSSADTTAPIPGESPLPTPADGMENIRDTPLAIPRPLTDAVWGHLPPHEREELYRSFTEKFLPKYESALKEYYRELAKRPRNATR